MCDFFFSFVMLKSTWLLPWTLFWIKMMMIIIMSVLGLARFSPVLSPPSPTQGLNSQSWKYSVLQSSVLFSLFQSFIRKVNNLMSKKKIDEIKFIVWMNVCFKRVPNTLLDGLHEHVTHVKRGLWEKSAWKILRTEDWIGLKDWRTEKFRDCGFSPTLGTGGLRTGPDCANPSDEYKQEGKFSPWSAAPSNFWLLN